MAIPERDDTAGAAAWVSPPPEWVLALGVVAPPPPPTAAVSAAAVSAAAVRRLVRLTGLAGELGGLGLHLAERFGGATSLFLSDQFAQGLLGLRAGGLVVVGPLLGELLCGHQALGELVGLLALGGQVGSFVLQVGHERIEFVGRHVARAQRHTGELVTLQHVVQVRGVLEERAQRGGTATDEGSQRHLAEAAAQLGEFGFLGRHPGLGLRDLDVELALGVDGLDVFLGQLVRLLLEAFEFVDDVFDLLALAVDRLGLHHGGCHGGNDECDRDSYGKYTKKLPHTNEAHPSEYDERVAKCGRKFGVARHTPNAEPSIDVCDKIFE